MMKASPVLLSENELRSALQPLLDRALAERLRLFQLQLEPRLVAMLDAANGSGGRRQAEMGARLATLLQAEDEEAVFEALWRATEDLGRSRALLVQWQQELAVWKSEGTNLPARITRAEQAELLEQGEALAITVREQAVGWLYWEGSKYSEPVRMEELALCLRATGLALLACGLREQASSAVRPPSATEKTGSDPATVSPQAQFAWLLLEDLAGLLQRDRAGQWQSAGRQREKASVFAGEIERCRRAFSERYPDSELVFEEAARGWAD